MMMPISFRNASVAGLLAVLGLLVPVLAGAQPPVTAEPPAPAAQAPAHKPGGEANLILPDLSRVSFQGIN